MTKPKRISKFQNRQAKKEFFESSMTLASFYRQKFGKEPTKTTKGWVRERTLYRQAKGLEPSMDEQEGVIKETDGSIVVDNKDDEKAKEALKQIQDLDEKTIRNVGLVFKRGMFALMMEVQRNVEYATDERSKETKIVGVKDIGKLSKCLEELRIFAKMPKYYSAVKPTGLDPDDEDSTDATGKMFTNPISPVQIILSNETNDDETNQDVSETVDDIQDVDGQGNSD